MEINPFRQSEEDEQAESTEQQRNPAYPDEGGRAEEATDLEVNYHLQADVNEENKESFSQEQQQQQSHESRDSDPMEQDAEKENQQEEEREEGQNSENADEEANQVHQESEGQNSNHAPEEADKLTEEGEEELYERHEGVFVEEHNDGREVPEERREESHSIEQEDYVQEIDKAHIINDGVVESQQINPAENIHHPGEQLNGTQQYREQLVVSAPIDSRSDGSLDAEDPPSPPQLPLISQERPLAHQQEASYHSVNHHAPPVVVNAQSPVPEGKTTEVRVTEEIHAPVVVALQKQETRPASVLIPTAVVTSPPLTQAVAVEPPQPPEPQQEFQILIPVPLFLTANQLHKMISSAYYERKEINVRYFTRYVHNRNQYYVRHAAVLDDITECILARMKRTAEYLTETTSYFRSITEAYRTFFQESGKLTEYNYLTRNADMTTKNRHQWSNRVIDGAKKLLLSQNATVGRMRSQQYYLETNSMQALKKIAKSHEDQYRKNGKRAMQFKDKFCNFQERIIAEVKDIHSKVAKENKQRKKGAQPVKYDLLELQLKLLEDMQKSRVLLEDWGKAQLQWWRQSIEQEKATVESLKEVFKGYLASTQDLHVAGSPVRTCLEYWETTQTSRDVELQWQPIKILSVMSLDFVRNSLQLLDNTRASELSLQQLNQWSQLNNLSKATGQREVLMDSLTIKIFECEFNTGKSWVPGLLVSTIDENLIFLTEFFERKKHSQSQNPELNEDLRASHQPDRNHYHVVRRVNINNLLNTRKDEHTVSVNEKAKGILFDSWVKELVRFRTPDIAEEFMYFTENKLELKKEYVV